ncbi:tetratricopeptide repeat protein [Luteolibacter arcticus]|uniref:Tetratricopeptide repeat protein n=1 Tax=Luteolibacter arcticus TaxID=1581411 RepID=A0ABT3GLJ9_9BACT|nr:tetratricopeptide repeat protein [Luteolibacter arcticus]MCW1924404.1 tetratricopeptide repeat protein [Luteolibacter arcticus]
MTDDVDAVCRRAMGFLELGLPEDALAELDELKVAHSAALHLRVDVLFRLKDWSAAAAICLPMTEHEPSDPGWWIQAAYAQRRARSIEEAEMVLLAALTRHPANGGILYNLACYACVQGRPDQARDYFRRAAVTDPDPMLAMGIGDPDLEEIRPWLLELQADHRSRTTSS